MDGCVHMFVDQYQYDCMLLENNIELLMDFEVVVQLSI